MPSYCTAQDVYRECGLSSSEIAVVDVEELIDDAEDWLDRFMQTTFTIKTITSEKYDGNDESFLFVRFYPVVALTALTIDSTTVTPSNVTIYNHTGRLQLKPSAEKGYFPRPTSTPQNVTVSYTYGASEVPRVVKKAVAKMAAMSSLSKKMGGSFGSITSYSLPELSVSKNPQYTVWLETFKQLEGDLNNNYFGMDGKAGVLRPYAKVH